MHEAFDAGNLTPGVELDRDPLIVPAKRSTHGTSHRPRALRAGGGEPGGVEQAEAGSAQEHVAHRSRLLAAGGEGGPATRSGRSGLTRLASSGEAAAIFRTSPAA